MRTEKITAMLMLVLWGLGALRSQAEPLTNTHAVQVRMRNVLYHFNDEIVIHILELEGQLVPTGDLVIFDDPGSFMLSIHSAEVALSPQVLTNIMNQQVFAASDAPLKNLLVSVEGARLKIKGKLPAQGNIPFEVDSTLRADPDGKIRIQAEKIKAAHLPIKGLMDLVGVRIEGLIRTQKVRGLRAEKNDLILDPGEVFPPPKILAHLTSVRIAGNQILQVYGGKATAPAAGTPAGNFMAYRGNQLRFGKLTMSDSDMILIDLDPEDPFDFYLAHYKEQLVAGYTKTTPQFGLRVFMRDYNKLAAGQKKRARGPQGVR